MDYKEDLKKCYSGIMSYEGMVMQFHMMYLLSPTPPDFRPVFRTLDQLKLITVYAWVVLGYGPYTDFFKGQELPNKFNAMLETTPEMLLMGFKIFLEDPSVVNLPNFDKTLLRKLTEVINSL